MSKSTVTRSPSKQPIQNRQIDETYLRITSAKAQDEANQLADFLVSPTRRSLQTDTTTIKTKDNALSLRTFSNRVKR